MAGEGRSARGVSGIQKALVNHYFLTHTRTLSLICDFNSPHYYFFFLENFDLGAVNRTPENSLPSAHDSLRGDSRQFLAGIKIDPTSLRQMIYRGSRNSNNSLLLRLYT